MKTLSLIGSLLFFLGFFWNCQDVKVGYLETENAQYQPDSMVIKSVLDTSEDSLQIRYQIPWQSTSIEGIQGTMPIHYAIENINQGAVTPEIKNQFHIVRKGIIEIPYDHTLPPGKYIIDLRVYNEGYSYILPSIYTVIVQ